MDVSVSGASFADIIHIKFDHFMKRLHGGSSTPQWDLTMLNAQSQNISFSISLAVSRGIVGLQQDGVYDLKSEKGSDVLEEELRLDEDGLFIALSCGKSERRCEYNNVFLLVQQEFSKCHAGERDVMSYGNCAVKGVPLVDFLVKVPKACAAGTFNEETAQTSSDACMNCPRGRFSPNPGTESCRLCAPGRVNTHEKSVTNSSCIACSPGYYSAADRANCVACPAGFYASEPGAACSRCRFPSFSIAASARCNLTGNSCPGGTFKDEHELACVSCGSLGPYSDPRSAAGQFGSCFQKGCPPSYETRGFACLKAACRCPSGKGTIDADVQCSACVGCQPGFFSSVTDKFCSKNFKKLSGSSSFVGRIRRSEKLIRNVEAEFSTLRVYEIDKTKGSEAVVVQKRRDIVLYSGAKVSRVTVVERNPSLELRIKFADNDLYSKTTKEDTLSFMFKIASFLSAMVSLKGLLSLLFCVLEMCIDEGLRRRRGGALPADIEMRQGIMKEKFITNGESIRSMLPSGGGKKPVINPLTMELGKRNPKRAEHELSLLRSRIDRIEKQLALQGLKD
eukprot:g674.t1